MRYFKKIINLFKKTWANSLIGETVIRFTTHGCMGSDHEFDWIGTIVGTTYPKNCDGKLFYKVKILKNTNGELRDGDLKRNFEEIPSWYLQDLGGDFFIIYD